MVQVDTSHLQRLVAEGFGVDLLATVLGVSDNTINGLINGGRTDRERAARIRTLTRQEILTAAPERCHVPTIGAQRRVHALMRIGWSQSAIASGNRSMMRIIQGVCTGEGRYMLAGTHRFIAARYDTLSMKEGSSLIVRRIGERRGYPSPLAWDDDDLDDPTALPALRPIGAGPYTEERTKWFTDFINHYRAGNTIEQTCALMGVTAAAAERKFREWLPDHPLKQQLAPARARERQERMAAS
jgi:hypothetical protein